MINRLHLRESIKSYVKSHWVIVEYHMIKSQCDNLANDLNVNLNIDKSELSDAILAVVRQHHLNFKSNFS